jgi:L-ascorbate metabolism protein UlaG (beta-lactamase superfamily)
MKLKWLGHSCFLLTSINGIRVLTDPFEERIGYSMPDIEADIVTTSHEHGDHNNVSIVKGNFTHIKTPIKVVVKNIDVLGVSAFHDDSNGSKRGNNTIFKFTIDGIRICHCGDLGHILSEEQLKTLGEVDVLLLPVGGTFTLDAEGACKVIKQINPSITIPMHFKTDALNFSIDGINKFLASAGGGEMAGRQEIELEKDNLNKYANILVLNYK